MAGNKERTFLMVKPDGVQRGLIGKIIQRFEDRGFKLVAMKMIQVSFSTYAYVSDSLQKNMHFLVSNNHVIKNFHFVSTYRILSIVQ